MARVGDRVVTYLPRTTALKFKLDGARGWTATVLDMEDKRIAKLPVRDNGDGTVRVAQHPFEHDALVILAPGANGSSPIFTAQSLSLGCDGMVPA